MVASRAEPSARRPQRGLTEEGEPAPALVGDLAQTRAAAATCRACPLWAPATQTVFGEGPERASLMLVGEQPGDAEDLAGRPFVGPAGRLLDRALREAGIDRGAVYVTNAVKHFKFVPRGKRRIHEKPGRVEIVACKPWLEREIALVRPDLVVALGATAVQALTGKAMPIGVNRGRPHDSVSGPPVFVTVHPSFLLRLPDEEAKRLEFERFVADLAAAREAVQPRAVA